MPSRPETTTEATTTTDEEETESEETSDEEDEEEEETTTRTTTQTTGETETETETTTTHDPAPRRSVTFKPDQALVPPPVRSMTNATTTSGTGATTTTATTEDDEEETDEEEESTDEESTDEETDETTATTATAKPRPSTTNRPSETTTVTSSTTRNTTTEDEDDEETSTGVTGETTSHTGNTTTSTSSPGGGPNRRTATHHSTVGTGATTTTTDQESESTDDEETDEESSSTTDTEETQEETTTRTTSDPTTTTTSTAPTTVDVDPKRVPKPPPPKKSSPEHVDDAVKPELSDATIVERSTDAPLRTSRDPQTSDDAAAVRRSTADGEATESKPARPSRGWGAARGAVVGEDIPTKVPDGVEIPSAKRDRSLSKSDEKRPSPTTAGAESTAKKAPGTTDSTGETLRRRSSATTPQPTAVAPSQTTAATADPQQPQQQQNPPDASSTVVVPPPPPTGQLANPPRYLPDETTDEEEESTTTEEDASPSRTSGTVSDIVPRTESPMSIPTPLTKHREAIFFDVEHDTPSPPHRPVYPPKDFEHQPARLSIAAKVLGDINGTATIKRDDVVLVLRALGIRGADAISRAATPASTREARVLVEKRSVERLRFVIGNHLCSVDPYHSGEVTSQQFQHVFGGIDGFSRFDRRPLSMALDFARSRVVIAAEGHPPVVVPLVDLQRASLEFDARTAAASVTVQRGTHAGNASVKSAPLQFKREREDSRRIDQQAFSTLQFIGQAYKRALYEDSAVGYEDFVESAILSPYRASHETARGFPPMVDALVTHFLQPRDALEELRSPEGESEPCLWSFFCDNKSRHPLALPDVQTDAGVAHAALRSTTAPVLRMLTLETVNLEGFIDAGDLKADSTVFALCTLIRLGKKDGGLVAPARLRAEVDKKNKCLWRFAIKKSEKPRLFFAASKEDLLYIEYCVHHRGCKRPLCIGYTTLGIDQLLKEAEGEKPGDTRDKTAEVAPPASDVAMWVNKGTFFNRQKPSSALVGGSGAACCGGGSVDTETMRLAFASIRGLPAKLIASGKPFDTTLLQCLPHTMICPFFHLHFLTTVWSLFFTAQQATSVYTVMKQDPFYHASLIMLDHNMLDVVAVHWNARCATDLKMRDARPKDIEIELSQMVSSLYAELQVGGADQLWDRFWAAKGEADAKVKPQNDAPNQPHRGGLAAFGANAATLY